MEVPIGEKPWWISYVSDQFNVHAVGLRCPPCASSRMEWRCWISEYTHMSSVRSRAKPLAGPCLSVCPFSHLLSHKCKDLRGPCVDPSFYAPCLSLIHMHTHSYSDTIIQCPRSQSLASSRCLKTGGTSVLDSPSSPLPLATFVGKRLAVKSNRKTASQPLCPRRPDTKFL